jgi:hypothetical protein
LAVALSPPPLILIARELRESLRASVRMEPAVFRAEGINFDYLSQCGRVHTLGFVSVTDLAEERLQMSARTARERLKLHRTLTVSPEIDRAFMGGEITASQVLTIAPIVSHEPVTPWIELAKRTALADLQKEVKRARPAAETDPIYKKMRVPVPLKVKLTFLEIFDFAQKQIGHDAGRNELMEAFLAETGWAGQGITGRDIAQHDSGSAASPPLSPPDGYSSRDGYPQRNWCPAPAEYRPPSGCPSRGGSPPSRGPQTTNDPSLLYSALHSARAVPPFPADGSSPMHASEEDLAFTEQAIEDLHGFIEDFIATHGEAPQNPISAYDRLRELRMTRNQLRAIQGRLLRALRRTRSHRVLGYKRMEDFIVEDLHISARTAREMVSESYIFEDHPALEIGFALGQIGVSKAYRIKRVSTGREPDIDAWIERGARTTVRTFERECKFMELLRKCDPRLASHFRGPFPHPGLAEAIETKLCTRFKWTARRLNHEMRIRGIARDGRGSSDAGKNFALMDRLETLLTILVNETYPDAPPFVEPIPFETKKRQTSALGEPWVMLDISMTTETFADTTVMILDFRRRFGAETARYVPILLAALHFYDTWSDRDPEAPVADQAAVFRRDRNHCLIPGCRRRGPLQGHHIVFRSHGGTDHLWNRMSACAGHHQHVIHLGLIKVTGKAPWGLRFEIGRRPDGRPLMTTEGGIIVDET